MAARSTRHGQDTSQLSVPIRRIGDDAPHASARPFNSSGILARDPGLRLIAVVIGIDTQLARVRI
jgi:hypothetical protein